MELTTITSTIRKVSGNRWVAVALLLGAVGLFILIAANLGGGKLALPQLPGGRDARSEVVPVKRIEQLSTKLASTPDLPFANGQHPLFTLYFKPAPPPVVVETPAPPPPPPPPPPMKKVQLVYRGVYESSDGKSQAFLVVDNKLSMMAMGSNVVADWAVAEIGRQKLALTNALAQTNILQFNRAMELEIPATKP